MGNEDQEIKPPRQSGLWMIARIAFITLAVFLSLLTFPSGIPWLMAFWILWHTTSVLKQRPGWLPLLVGILITIIKRPDWSPEIGVLLCAGMVIVVIRGLAGRLNRNPGDSRRWNRFGLCSTAALILLWIFFAVRYDQHSSRSSTASLDLERPVVCLGDSLTAYGYPDLLAEKLVVPVVDMGQDGIKTEDGLKRLPKIIASNPQAVVLELGGHDFNQGLPRKEAKSNLETLITTCQKKGIAVILVEVPRGFISDGYDGLERQLARNYDLELISDGSIRSFVLLSPICPPGSWIDKKWHRSRDGLHPNQNGNQVFASEIARGLANVFGDEILKNPKAE